MWGRGCWWRSSGRRRCCSSWPPRWRRSWTCCPTTSRRWSTCAPSAAGRRLAVSPSPIYGPSRIFLGYVAMLGVTANLGGLDAGLATAAFALPLTILFAAAGRLVARTLGSRYAGRGLGPARDRWDPADDPEATSAAYWVLLTLPLTFAFLRLPDTRATVLAFVPAALALVLALDASRWGGRSTPVLLAVSLGVGILVHPAIGAFALGTVAVIGLVSVESDPAGAGGSRWRSSGGVSRAARGRRTAGVSLGRTAADARRGGAGGDPGRSCVPRRLVDPPGGRLRAPGPAHPAGALRARGRGPGHRADARGPTGVDRGGPGRGGHGRARPRPAADPAGAVRGAGARTAALVGTRVGGVRGHGQRARCGRTGADRARGRCGAGDARV